MGPSTSDLARPTTTSVSPDRAAVPGPEMVLRRMGACIGRHVNNALTGVIGYLELGLREATGKGVLQGHLQESLACAYQAAEMVKRLVAFASQNVRAGSLMPVSLRRLAQEAAHRTSLAHGNLEVSVTGDPNGWALCDANLLRSCLDQVVQNAVEALNGEGTLTFEVKEEPGHALLQLHDSGPGFSAEAAAHLFDPFWTSKPNGHLGLGLVLCRDSLHAQGGKLVVASTPGAGAQVTLSLPAAALDAPPVPDDASTATTIVAPSTGAIVTTSA